MAKPNYVVLWPAASFVNTKGGDTVRKRGEKVPAYVDDLTVDMLLTVGAIGLPDASGASNGRQTTEPDPVIVEAGDGDPDDGGNPPPSGD